MPETVHNVKCESCGGSMTYTPGTMQLSCEQCESTVALPKDNDLIVEMPLDMISLEKGIKVGALPEELAVDEQATCSSCGAHIIFVGTDLSESCPYCDSPVVRKVEKMAKVFVPQGILGFSIAKEEAIAHIQKRLKNSWFTPNDLVTESKLNALSSTFVPSFTFDAQTDVVYRGMRGDKVRVYEDGKFKTRTDWSSVSGRFRNFFDDVVVTASATIEQVEMLNIQPFPLDKLVNFDPRFLLGHAAEVQEDGTQAGFEKAVDCMKLELRTKAMQQIGGDSQIVSHVEVAYSDLSYKYVMLPFWITSFRYHGKVYRCLVNGATGKVVGSLPLSFWKIFFAVATVVFMVWYFELWRLLDLF